MTFRVHILADRSVLPRLPGLDFKRARYREDMHKEWRYRRSMTTIAQAALYSSRLH